MTMTKCLLLSNLLIDLIFRNCHLRKINWTQWERLLATNNVKEQYYFIFKKQRKGVTMRSARKYISRGRCAYCVSIFRHSRCRSCGFTRRKPKELNRLARKSREEWGNFISARPRLHVTMNESVNKRTLPRPAIKGPWNSRITRRSTLDPSASSCFFFPVRQSCIFIHT